MKDCVLFYPIVSDHLINIQGMVKQRRPSDSYELVFKVTFKTSRNAFS